MTASPKGKIATSSETKTVPAKAGTVVSGGSDHEPGIRKQRAAQAALEFVRDGAVVGVGTGSTVNFFIEGLASHARPDRRGGIELGIEHAAAPGARLPVLDLNATGELAALCRRRRRGDAAASS